MSQNQSELSKRNVLRLSNEESNKITRECIEIAFMDLLSEKNMDKITISEIAQKAGVSRSALYRNYNSKDAILEATFENILDYTKDFSWILITGTQPAELYRSIFEKIQREAHVFGLIIKSGVPIKNFTNMKTLIAGQFPQANNQTRQILLGWESMFFSIIMDWFTDDMNEDIDSMVELCCSLSSEILHQIEVFQPCFLKDFRDAQNQ